LIAGIKNELHDLFSESLSFEQLCVKAGQDPNDGDPDPKILQETLDELILAKARKIEEEYPHSIGEFPFKDASWSLGQPQVIEELKKLPVLDPFSSLVFSYSCDGLMDHDTGELFYTVSACGFFLDKIRIYFACKGIPTTTRWVLEQAIWAALAKPMPNSGPPQLPAAILFAHRWGRELPNDLGALLREKLDIVCRFESREEALLSAAQNDTDPDGNNF
jgi:hypothetical protein